MFSARVAEPDGRWLEAERHEVAREDILRSPMTTDYGGGGPMPIRIGHEFIAYLPSATGNPQSKIKP